MNWILIVQQTVVGICALVALFGGLWAIQEGYQRWIEPHEAKLALILGLTCGGLLFIWFCWLVGSIFIRGDIWSG